MSRVSTVDGFILSFSFGLLDEVALYRDPSSSYETHQLVVFSLPAELCYSRLNKSLIV